MSLEERVQRRVSEALGTPVVVKAIRPLLGGACQDNFRVDLEIAGAPRRVALRSDARSSLPGSVSRAVEFAVITAARGEGARTPAARWPAAGLVRDGASAYFLDWIDGEAIGARVTRHPRLATARARLPAQLAETLAAIHRVTPVTHPDLPIVRPPFLPGLDPAEVAIGFLTTLLDALGHPRPAAEYGVAWLRRNRPAPVPLSLVHGDFRTGNFMVGPDGLLGVLDWEFTHWGDPMEDIGWLCTRDWRFGQVDLPVGGFADRATFYRAYAAAREMEVDAARVHFWEVMGNLRWGVAAALQGRRYAAEGANLELLAIPRRAVEMEYEALRLIEVGPPTLED